LGLNKKPEINNIPVKLSVHCQKIGKFQQRMPGEWCLGMVAEFSVTFFAGDDIFSV
jgi:hypothetical protein